MPQSIIVNNKHRPTQSTRSDLYALALLSMGKNELGPMRTRYGPYEGIDYMGPTRVRSAGNVTVITRNLPRNLR